MARAFAVVAIVRTGLDLCAEPASANAYCVHEQSFPRADIGDGQAVARTIAER